MYQRILYIGVVPAYIAVMPHKPAGSPPIPVTAPNSVQIRLIFASPSRSWGCILHALKNGSPTIDQTLANTVGSTIKGLFTSSGLAAVTHPSYGLAQVGLRDINAANLAEYFDAGATVVGTATGDLLPSRTALCITHRTAQAGKRYRGRSYLGGFTEANSDAAGKAATAATSAGVAFFNGIRTGLPGTLLLGVTHLDRYDITTGTKIEVGFTTPITTSISRNNNFETQRRRVS